jgi:hypothetical protein
MWILRVKDRGRDLATHTVERKEEARELRRVYEQIGYPPEKLVLEPVEEREQRAAA